MNGPENRDTPIERLGKFGLIDRLCAGAGRINPGTVKGPGDDACIIDTGNSLTLVSSDLLMEGIHFNLVYTPVKHLGYKAVIRGISDIFAMNGRPGQILVSLGISSRFSVEQIDSLYEGIYLACRRYNIDLAGGDTTSSLTGLTIGITSIGTVDRESVTTRDGAGLNDLVCVTGDLGAAYMGLQVLEREGRLFGMDKSFKPDLTGYEYIIERQLKPEFPVDVLEQIREKEILPTSMIDVSDGLASDILHICKSSGTGCRLYYEKIPIDTETFNTAEEFGIDPVVAALNGGDDYELLFTSPPANYSRIMELKDVRIIGHLTASDQGHMLISPEGTAVELKAQGWNKL